MEALKHRLGPAVVEAMARQLLRVDPGFDAAGFRQAASDGLEALELKARARHIAQALEGRLPEDFEAAAARLVACLAPAAEPGEAEGWATGGPASSAGLAGWAVWPLTEYVARHGLHTPDATLQALHAMTQRFTGEWAIRPCLEAHPARVFATLERWSRDPSAHVRRLVSEGSRPRLPWGLQLRALIDDPSPTLPLLARLQDDPSPYVRRSVANHLNDIARDHPARVVDWLAVHLPGASDERRALLRHASRSLIKQGHAATLEAWGLGRAYQGGLRFALLPRAIRLGEAVELQVELRSAAAHPQSLVIDYAVHHVKADGRLSAKVFKGWNLLLDAGASKTLRRRHAMRPITTRRYHAGRHEVDLRINGQVLARAAFELQL